MTNALLLFYLLYYLCRGLLVYGFLFSILDGFSTFLAIRNGAHEANYGYSWLMRLIGPKWVIPRILIAQGSVWVNVVFGHRDWIAAGTLFVIGAFLTFVVWSNLRLAGWWK